MLDEQQETSTADPEAVSVTVLEDSRVEKLADIQVVERITSFHSAPLPDAETLSAYAKLIPNPRRPLRTPPPVATLGRVKLPHLAAAGRWWCLRGVSATGNPGGSFLQSPALALELQQMPVVHEPVQ